jgi:hypothetical protein
LGYIIGCFKQNKSKSEVDYNSGYCKEYVYSGMLPLVVFEFEERNSAFIHPK